MRMPYEASESTVGLGYGDKMRRSEIVGEKARRGPMGERTAWRRTTARTRVEEHTRKRWGGSKRRVKRIRMFVANDGLIRFEEEDS